MTKDELTAIAKVMANVIKDLVIARVDKLEAENRTLRAQLNKAQQGISANSKHSAALEQKFSELARRG
jgi:hypothetical protein